MGQEARIPPGTQRTLREPLDVAPSALFVESGVGDQHVAPPVSQPVHNDVASTASSANTRTDMPEPGHGAGADSADLVRDPLDLATLIERIPEGWTLARYANRLYGLSRTTRVNGRSLTVFAEELGGQDLISANIYRTSEAVLLRTCEMPEPKVLHFLSNWVAV